MSGAGEREIASNGATPKTAEAVRACLRAQITPLKQGVSEITLAGVWPDPSPWSVRFLDAG